jgi:hypothetical protein
MDSPQRGASSTDKFQNVMEAATILDPFELVFQEAVLKLNKMGIEGMDLETSIAQLKPAYEAIRHGLAFDWVVNSCVGIIIDHYPFSPHIEYKGTRVFIEDFKDDIVFDAEVSRLHQCISDVMNWVFEGYPDRSVYKRLSGYAKTTDLATAYEYVLHTPPKEPFELPLLTSARVNYAILLMEMLSLCVGKFNRVVWTDRIHNVQDSAPGHEDLVIVVGGEDTAFVYGDIDDTGVARWTKLPNGITVYLGNTRVDRTDVVRVAPDEMTFFWFSDTEMMIDESKVPTIQFDLPDGTTTDWINPRMFIDMPGFTLDAKMKMRVKYEFPQFTDDPKTISLKGSLGTVVKDKLIVLDSNGIGETQVVFRSNVISFKVADPDKKYPFTFFSSSLIENPEEFEWLK